MWRKMVEAAIAQNASIEPARFASGGEQGAGRPALDARRLHPRFEPVVRRRLGAQRRACRRSAPATAPAPQEVQWVVNAYLLPLSALLLLGGALGDHFGRRRLLVIGTSIFAVDLAGLRAGAEPADPARRARRAGHRRGAAAAQQPRAAQRRLPGREARPRGRHLGCGGRRGGGGRAADRRLAGRHRRLAGDLLHQPAARARRDPACAAVRRRKPRSRRRAGPIMPARCSRRRASAASPTRSLCGRRRGSFTNAALIALAVGLIMLRGLPVGRTPPRQPRDDAARPVRGPLLLRASTC